MFVQRAMLTAALAGTLCLGIAPARASDLVTQNSGGGLQGLFRIESVGVTRGPVDFFSIFRPKEPKKRRTTVRRAPTLKISPRPKGRETIAVAGALAGLGAIEDTVAKQALDDGMGRLQGYQVAEAARVATEARLVAVKDLLRTLDAQAAEERGPAKILRDLEALDLDSDDYAEDFADLKAELDAGEIRTARREALTVEIARLETEALSATERADQAFVLAANGRDLSPETRRDLNHLLGLPDPKTQ